MLENRPGWLNYCTPFAPSYALGLCVKTQPVIPLLNNKSNAHHLFQNTGGI